MPFYQYFEEKFLRKFGDNGHISVLAFFVFVEIISTGYIVIPRNPRAWYSVEKDLTVGRNIHHNLIAGFKLFPDMSQTIHQGPKTISQYKVILFKLEDKSEIAAQKLLKILSDTHAIKKTH